ncbi:hypothetical protein [Methylosinus sp. R-45379]|uniref:hypothetical protein n=1 Tax=Methylosinus sp. R-45379 TaxID=980563 RepID=UPI0012ED49A8|nr:hypothetical protein [Methylosinus sp. R-45379]
MLLGAHAAARALGAREITPSDASEGDVALIAQRDQAPALAMRARHAYVAASFGRLLIICEPVVLATWRIG